MVVCAADLCGVVILAGSVDSVATLIVGVIVIVRERHLQDAGVQTHCVTGQSFANNACHGGRSLRDLGCLLFTCVVTANTHSHAHAHGNSGATPWRTSPSCSVFHRKDLHDLNQTTHESKLVLELSPPAAFRPILAQQQPSRHCGPVDPL